jgi:hypothetical protein
MKHCICQQEGRVHGTVKSTRLEDVEYDVANLKRDNKDIHSLYRTVEDCQRELHALKYPKPWRKRLYRWIYKFVERGSPLTP